MQWWNQFITWLSTDAGRVVIQNGVIPFVAIVIAGVVAALIGRAASKRILAFQDRELKAAAVMALISAGRKATVWSSLGGDEKQRVDNQLHEADIRVRLLPLNGTNAAADWAAHEIAKMKKNSSSFSFQAEQSFVDYRDRLLEWQSKPKRARKLFAYDLEQWRYEDAAADKNLVEKQQEWAATQLGNDATAETVAVEKAEEAAPSVAPAPTTSVAAPETFATAPISPTPAPSPAPVPPTAFPMPAATMAQPQVPTPFSSPAPVSSPTPVSSPAPVNSPTPASEQNQAPKVEVPFTAHKAEEDEAEGHAATNPFGAATFSAPGHGAPTLDSPAKNEEAKSAEDKGNERYVPPATSWSIRKATAPEQSDKPRGTF